MMDAGRSPDRGCSVPAQVQECYVLAADGAGSQEMREILQARLSGIRGLIPCPVLLGRPDSLQAAASKAARLLTDGTPSAQQAVSALPDSPEREFLMALDVLSRGRSETQLAGAARHIAAALAKAPGTPRYAALAEVLQEAAGTQLGRNV